MNQTRILFPCLAVLALACGGEDKQVKSADTTNTSSTTPVSTSTDPKPGEATMNPATTPTPLTGDTAGMKNDLSATKNDAPTTVNLTDDQILQVVHSANVAEVEQGKVAQKKAKNARVKKFAEMMVKHHTDADKAGGETGKKNKINMTSSSTSSQFESEAAGMMTTLSSANAGAEFDKAYMEAQVKAHKAVIELIDTKLTAQAQNPELKKHLQGVRTKVEGHLKEAQEIQKSL